MPELVEVTKNYTVYSLDEMLADKKLKEKLLKANEPDEWAIESDLKIEIEELYSQLEEKGFMNPNILYDISYCQGSGACFDCDDISLQKVLKDVYKDLGLTEEDYNIIVKLEEDDFIKYCTYTNSYANHYCHSKTRYIAEKYNYDYDDYPEYARSHWKNDNDEMDEVFGESGTIIRYLVEEYQDNCYKLYKQLQDRYEYMMSEEYISQDLRENGYNKFLENGTIFNY